MKSFISKCSFEKEASLRLSIISNKILLEKQYLTLTLSNEVGFKSLFNGKNHEIMTSILKVIDDSEVKCSEYVGIGSNSCLNYHLSFKIYRPMIKFCDKIIRDFGNMNLNTLSLISQNDISINSDILNIYLIYVSYSIKSLSLGDSKAYHHFQKYLKY